MSTLSIANEFSKYPAGRYPSDGPNSGERFREEFLMPQLLSALRLGEQVEIVFDGIAGLPSSFLEESFGGVLRVDRSLNSTKMLSVLKFLYADPAFQRYEELIRMYVRNAESDRSV